MKRYRPQSVVMVGLLLGLTGGCALPSRGADIMVIELQQRALARIADFWAGRACPPVSCVPACVPAAAESPVCPPNAAETTEPDLGSMVWD